MITISSSGNFIGMTRICLDRLLKQRSALRKPDLSFGSLWGRYPEAGFGLVGVVATSVSEWMSFHSLTLAATPEMKKMRRIGIQAIPIKCPGVSLLSAARETQPT
jgi:hypothetical protein